MKVMCYLFVLLVSFMASYPCSDGATCVDEKKSGYQITADTHQHSSGELDLCSPFCQCSCCHSQASPALSYHFNTSNKAMALKKVIAPVSRVQSIHHSIWQPPKLS